MAGLTLEKLKRCRAELEKADKTVKRHFIDRESYISLPLNSMVWWLSKEQSSSPVPLQSPEVPVEA